MSYLYKIFGVLALIGLGVMLGVGYVWYELAFGPHTIVDTAEEKTSHSAVVTEEGIPTERVDTTSPGVSVSNTSTAPTEEATSTSSSTPTISKPVTIDEEKLSPGQAKLLKTLGIDTENLVVTPAMQKCAVDALGQTRFDEIIQGATPSISEGLNLVVCYKK
jgi:hypothetical protein